MFLSGDSVTFDRRNILFHYAWPENFGRCQWILSDRRLLHAVFVGYRIFVALYFTTSCIISFAKMQDKKYFLIYLTNWGGMMLGVYLWFALALSVIELKRGHKYYSQRPIQCNQWESRTGLIRRIFWTLFEAVSTVTIVISCVYWGTLYRGTKSTLGFFYTFNMHGVNSLIIIIEHLLVATPVRLFHCWIPQLIGTVYILFTMIYHAAEGKNPRGKPFIYSILDYTNHPAKAAGYIAVIAAVAPLVHAGIYGVYLLKRALYKWLTRCLDKKAVANQIHPLNEINRNDTTVEGSEQNNDGAEFKDNESMPTAIEQPD